MASGLNITELTETPEIAHAYQLMALLRPHLIEDRFVDQIRAQQQDGYRLIGGFVAGHLVALAGYRLARTLSRGPHLFVDDLVTAPADQGKGYGQAMLRHLANIAKNENLPRIWLDSRDTAKTFYQQTGFTLHTSIPCWIETEKLR
jgi:GNAT superfamily N-acetyltransferase